jgi:glycosyltransferase involved in cell wall biosynthesis
MAAYGGPYEGSFIPMVRSLCAGAVGRGWTAQAVFSPDAAGRPWYESIGEELDARLAPDTTRRELTAWTGELIAGRDPVVLHTHFTRYDLAALAAARSAAGKAGVLWHVHTPLYSGARANLRNAVKYGVLGRRVAAILASGSGPARTLERVGAPAARLEIAGSGVRTDRFSLVSAAERARARVALGIPDDTQVLLHFGWDWHLKGGDLFLESLRALEGELGGRFVALTVGRDPAAAEAIARSGLDERVRLLEPRDDVASLYAAADVFVTSSRVEGEPFAVIEAILSGVPVAANDLPGHVDVCADLDSCRVVAGRAPALAAAIEGLLARPSSAASEQRLAAREDVARRFDLGAWTERMLDRYEAALS